MCLYIKEKEPPIKSLDIYKVVTKYSDLLISPLYRSFRYVAGINEAIGIPKVKLISKGIYGIEEGVLHCFLNINRADEFSQSVGNNRIIKCIGQPEDFVAYGHNDEVGFKKIYIEIEEIKQALK